MNAAGIYLRVSSDSQDSSNQLPGCRQLAAARGLEIVEVYADEGISGDAAKRPALERALFDAHARKFRVLIAWSVDRISRDGATGLLKLLERLDAAGVQFLSVREPYLDSAGPFRDVVLSLLGTFARMEKQRLRERTLAGLARARAAGIRLGRPCIHPDLIQKGLARAAVGESVALVAKAMGISDTTLRRARVARGVSQPHRMPQESDPGLDLNT